MGDHMDDLPAQLEWAAGLGVSGSALMRAAAARIRELEAEVERWREKDRRDLRGAWRP